MKTVHIFLGSFLIALVALTSCEKNKQDWSVTENSPVTYTATKSEITIAEKPFVMEHISLGLTDLVLTGDRLQSNSIYLTQPTNGGVNFLNPIGSPSFDIPLGTYPQMQLSTGLLQNDIPSIDITGTYYFPNNTFYEVSIQLDLAENYNIPLKDVDGSSTILIKEEQSKMLLVLLDTEKLFSEINPGLWNAAAVTSQNGSQTIVVDEMNNDNIYNALSSKIGESLFVKFN